MLNYPKRFKGTCWFSYEPISIDRAIYRSEREIVVEFLSEGWRYTVSLTSSDGRVFQGEYSSSKGGDTEKGVVTGRVFWDETGPVLIGSWHEGGKATWFVRLTEVSDFNN